VAWPYVPQGVASAQINMYYALAVMALDRAAMIEQFSEARLADPLILAFIPRIRIAASAEFDTRRKRVSLCHAPAGDHHGGREA